MEGRGLGREWGPFHFHPCPGTHIIRHPPSPYPVLASAPPNTLTSPGRMPVDTSQARARMGGWGRHVVRGASSGQSHLSLTPAPGTLPPPRLWCRAQKGAEEEERRGAGGDREGRGGDDRGGQGGSAAQFVAKFFFSPLSPFSYVKSARKLGSLFATVSSVSWRGGRGGGDPRPGTPAWD